MYKTPDQLLTNLNTLTIRDAARLMSAVESDEAFRQHVLAEYPAPYPNLIGVTGPPGVGKSQLVDNLLDVMRKRYPKAKLGVVAIDPSSLCSGGALLGDRIRMMRHAEDPLVHIRSMATRGHLGGLAVGAQAVARIMQIMGCKTVILETVGVGQNEIGIASVANCSLLVLAPGAGDDIQLIKSGIMEIGDILIVNKADQLQTDALQEQLLSALAMQHRTTQVFKVSALCGDGINELMDVIYEQWIT